MDKFTEPTQEQTKEFWEIKVRFKSYYKYSFTFSNGEGYEVTAGGIGDEIYRCSIKTNEEYTIRQVADECGGSLYVYLKDKLIHEDRW